MNEKIKICAECKDCLCINSDNMGICAKTNELVYIGSYCQFSVYNNF